MKDWNTIIITILFISSLFFLACSDGESISMTTPYECTFEQNDETMDGFIDENERAIMNACTDNALTNKTAITQNLIGEWELIGHGEGWVPKVSQPCGYIIIGEEELTLQFTSGYTDTVITYPWEIEERQHNRGTSFSLNLLPEQYFYPLYINQFCDEYMYGDGTPSDGNMYLYQKVK